MASKFNCTIYFDEHIHLETVEAFKMMGFRCVAIARTTKYAGREERDYINEIAAEGALFLTADKKFVDDIVARGTHDVGIILVPTGWEDSTLSFAAAGLAGCLRGAIDNQGKRSLGNQVYYIADDGYHLIEKGKDKLFYSVGRLELDMDEWGDRYKGVATK